MANKVNVRQRYGRIWYVDFAYRTKDGARRRFKRSTGPGVTSEEQARQLGLRWKTQADALGYVADLQEAEAVFENPDTKKESEYPFSGHAKKWFEDEQGQWKFSEVRSVESIIRVHLYPYFGHQDMRTILPEDIKRLQTLKKKAGKASQTNNNIISVVKCMFKSAYENRVVNRNVAADIKLLKVQKPRIRYYDEQQTRVFLDTAQRYEPTLFPLFQVAFTTGLRMGELIAMTWDQVDFVRQVIVVDRSVYMGHLNETKGFEVREVPMHPDTYRVLKEFRQLKHLQSDLVFPWHGGGYLSECRLKWPFKRIRRRAGLPDIRFHDIRHSYASMLVMRGVSLYKVGKLLGHKDVKTTERYAHLNRESLHSEVAKLFSDEGRPVMAGLP